MRAQVGVALAILGLAGAPAASAGNLGGGFLEMLAGGRAHPAPQPASAPTLGNPAHRQINPKFMRQEVAYDGDEPAGTIVVDTAHRFLFYVEGNGEATRYGVGVGREGFAWSGRETISRKAEWPTWTPPQSMLRRRPDLPHFMPGGEGNPLGARALYLGHTEYRIHGTNEPWSIGTNMSSGCIRMMNEDVRDLYNRVHVGTKVVVL
ncbi:MAG: L,D-transpeptidase [Hyphomicrobiales bacterium]|nr:L,D-transpeptidase [Hyphomicrobiales bacterium]